jgi:hypothetical protein
MGLVALRQKRDGFVAAVSGMPQEMGMISGGSMLGHAVVDGELQNTRRVSLTSVNSLGVLQSRGFSFATDILK